MLPTFTEHAHGVGEEKNNKTTKPIQNNPSLQPQEKDTLHKATSTYPTDASQFSSCMYM